MPRSPNSLNIRKWATRLGATLESAETAGFDREDGFPTSYDSTEYISVGLMNQMIKTIADTMKEIEAHGIGEWFSGRSEDWPVGAIVLGSDNRIYRAVAQSGNSGVNPTTDADDSHWTRFIPQIANATSSRSGFVEIATDSESTSTTTAGSSGAPLVVTPSQVVSAVENAVDALTADGVVTGANLSGTDLTLTRSGTLANIRIPLSILLTGYARPSGAVLTGTPTVQQPVSTSDDNTIANTAFVQSQVENFTPLDATTEQFGVAERATQAEVIAGTDTERFVTPAALAARLQGVQGNRRGIDGQDGQSLKGPKGDKGPKGRSVRGAKGPSRIGERGPQGPRGVNGMSIKGAKGPIGQQGDQGPQGDAPTVDKTFIPSRTAALQ